MISMTCLMGEPETAGAPETSVLAAFDAVAEDAAAEVMAPVAAARDTSPTARSLLCLTQLILGQQRGG